MNLSNTMKKALGVAAVEIAKAWQKESEECYEEGVDYTLKDDTIESWVDDGYEILDDVSMYLDQQVRKLLEKTT